MVNKDKTERTSLTRGETSWKEAKKVGSLLGDTEDVARRKRLSAAALSKLNNVWIRKDKIKTTTKLKLYRSLVKPVLTYNSGTWALTKMEEKRLDAFHRTQLRKVLGIRYPVKITNISLYKKCNETPLSSQILEYRWRLFGHILRRNEDIPARKAMKFYFTNINEKFPGRPLTTLPTVLNNDLIKVNNTYTAITLKSEKDLEQLTTLAKNRRRWKLLTRSISEAAKASRSDD